MILTILSNKDQILNATLIQIQNHFCKDKKTLFVIV